MSESNSQNQEDPILDKARLEEIARLDLLSKEAEALLQDVVDRAAKHFNLPKSMVSLVLDEAQYFIASKGLDGFLKESKGTPVEWAYCANSVRSRKEFIVEDSDTNEKVKDNPLNKLGSVKCYAGIPLISSNGHVLGNLCVVGTESRHFSDQDIEDLREMAREAVELIEKRASKKNL